jgi:hypothetical protein
VRKCTYPLFVVIPFSWSVCVDVDVNGGQINVLIPFWPLGSFTVCDFGVYLRIELQVWKIIFGTCAAVFLSLALALPISFVWLFGLQFNLPPKQYQLVFSDGAFFFSVSGPRMKVEEYAYHFLSQVHFPRCRSWMIYPQAIDMGARQCYTFPMYPVIVVTGIPTIVRMSKKRTLRNRIAHGQCFHCGYDLRASTNTCPECGAKISPVQKV